MIGSAGVVIMFVMSLAATAIVGSLLMWYTSHNYLVVVEDTAAGLDDVEWPDMGFFDWITRWIYVAWILAFWLVPTYLLAMVLVPQWAGTTQGFWYLFAGLFWLIFPVSLLSTMSGTTRWWVLHGPFLNRLRRHWLALILFYFMTAPIVVLAGYCIYQAIWHPNWSILLVGFPGLAALFLIHARLVGRIGYLVGYHTPEKKKSKTKDKELKVETQSKDPWETPVEAPSDQSDPSEGVPEMEPEILEGEKTNNSANTAIEEEEDEWEMRKKPYGILADDTPASPARKKNSARPNYVEEADPYEVLPPTEVAPAPVPMDGYKPVGVDKEILEPPEENETKSPLGKVTPYQARMWRRRSLPPPPKFPLLSGIFIFPWYPSSLRTWIYMSLLGMIVNIFCRVMAMTFQG